MDIAWLHEYTSELEQRQRKAGRHEWKAGGRGQMESEGDGDGATDKGGKRQERKHEGRLYHDITPLLCHYVSEQCSFSLTSGAA